MIAAAALLVLLGLGLFVGGILTGLTAYYWACVGACLVAAVLLVVVWRRLRTGSAGAATASEGAPTVRASTDPVTAVAPAAAGSASQEEVADAPAGGTSAERTTPAPPEDLGDPPVEEVEVTDLLLVVDLTDEVLVVDEHPRYHLTGCAYLGGRTAIPLPLDEARADGFTPCAVCAPDRTLAQRARDRR
ncbi:hypothetical protein FHU33_2846 [Blastococcus colisei]|uniref:Uncharacterized protein n=1 Tax=Blastococcus colisei TaxID=1564162 RepID=A0A543PH46_9ACTN|nr:hypothetical protein [Blastococcus colisei]TQN43402.1 hypothetical protein FHU33_2846 [Blastococcus colisei]